MNQVFWDTLHYRAYIWVQLFNFLEGEYQRRWSGGADMQTNLYTLLFV